LKGGFTFYFKKDAEFTLREWALTTGGYEFSIPADHAWAKCLTPVGESFDDGRYRQVSYKATVPDCKDVLVRVQAVVAGSTVKPAEQVWTFAVWPDRQPETKDMQVFDIDAKVMPEITVQAGTHFLVMSSEQQYAPNGFAWNKPLHKFACAEVVNDKWGGFKTGYSIWEFKAGDKKCMEDVPMVRSEWWTGEDKTAIIKLNVVRVECKTPCEPGMRFESDIACACVAVKTEEAVGRLFEAHKVAVGSVNRVIMRMGEDDKVTFREYADVTGAFKYIVDTSKVQFDCVAPLGEGVKEQYYQ